MWVLLTLQILWKYEKNTYVRIFFFRLLNIQDYKYNEKFVQGVAGSERFYGMLVARHKDSSLQKKQEFDGTFFL